jgi:hypothetical protein
MLLSGSARGGTGSSSGSLPLRAVARVPLSGSAVRFDYTSIDPSAKRLWIAHMDASQLLAFDVVHRRIVKTISVPGVHGVIAVPQLGRIYASATNAREVFRLNAQTGAILARAPAGHIRTGSCTTPWSGTSSCPTKAAASRR